MTPHRLAWIAWLTICLVWGTTYLAIRVALESMPVLALAGLRWLLAGLTLGMVAVAAGRPLPAPRTWGSLALLGFLMNVVGNGFVVWAQQYVASGLTAVVVASVPFWSLGVEAALPGGERLRWPAVCGVAVGFAGILVLVWPEVSLGGRDGYLVAGGVLALQVACLGWALGTSYTKRHPLSTDPLAALTVQMICSGVILLTLATLAGEWPTFRATPRSLIALLYLTIAGSAVAHTAYLYALAHLPIATVSLYAYVNPLIAVALGAVLLGEPISLRVGLAAGLVLAGIAIVRRVQSTGAPPASPRRAHT